MAPTETAQRYVDSADHVNRYVIEGPKHPYRPRQSCAR
jgi:hypothetical protein